MDVSKDSISVAILDPERDVAVTDKISSDAESVRRLIKRLGRPAGIWACYEAGPTGYDTLCVNPLSQKFSFGGRFSGLQLSS
jgi:hypothetical protein